jgi:putative inorganic carbon (HCO3(-)) transporter
LTERKHLKWIYLLSGIFVLANSILIVKEFFFLSIIPLVLALFFLGLLAMDKLLLVIVFLTPISIQLKEIIADLDFDLYLPTEPLLFGVMLLFIFKLFSNENIDRRLFLHPVSIAIYLNLIWIFFTSITSTLPLISFKFLIARLWFITAFYFLAARIFHNPKNIKRYIWFYVIPFLAVITYTIINHSQYGLINHKAAHSAVHPFYNDHTAYGAVIALFLPVLAGFGFLREKSRYFRVSAWIITGIFVGALVLSYSRAAWLSVGAAIMFFLIIKLRIRIQYLFLISVVTIALLAASWSEIILTLEKNRQDSSKEFYKHIQSVSNITSDVSNLERINRWKCAIRMFMEKPVFGWGPGTYMFQYAPFQVSYDRTIISTNFAERGNAHSEYLGPLSESGVLGALTIIIIVILSIITGLRVYQKSTEPEFRILSLSVLLGLVTYFTHGFLNNFLDSDKASAPFWGFIAILVAMDVFFTRKPGIREKNDIN